MKKILYLAIMLCCSLTGNAQGNSGIMYLTTGANYQILSISENGLWACGNYSEDGETSYGFRWNLSNNKIERFAASTSAYTVSNDGTVAGSYYTSAITGSSMEVPGLWKDGSWTMLELPNNDGAWATGITPDGHYVTGTDNNYVSYIWKDGKIQHTAKVKGIVAAANGTFLSYCISPDGSKIGGWAYYSGDNRNPGYWDTADQKFHELNPGVDGSPWQSVRKFTPDGKQLLFWGGYSQDPNNISKGYGIKAIYDLSTQKSQYVYPIWDDPFNFDLYDIGGKGSVVGYIQDNEGIEYGIIYANGKTQYVYDYLKALGADFSKYNMAEDSNLRPMLFRTMAISADEKTIGMIYYDSSYEFHSIVVRLDQNMEMTAPVQPQASQVAGLLATELKWEVPLGNTSTLKGYNVYRGGVKLNTTLITSTHYYDTNLQLGTYTYTVSAVYAEGESAKSDEVSITLVSRTPEMPRNIMARQKGYNSLLAAWDKPATNFIEKNYYSNATSTDGFGGDDVSFETGTLFSAEQISLYDGYKLSGVSFYPKSEQGSWIINVYRHVNDKLTLLKSETVTQQLEYGEKNTVMFSKPLTLQAGQDLLIGVQTNVTNPSYDIQGVFDGCLQKGYTDLIRQIGEADFYSMNMAGQTTYDVAWGTSALIAPADAANTIDAIDHYNVYVDGTKKQETKELQFEQASTAAGNHTVGVQAVYADARQSEIQTTTVSTLLNEDVLRITPNVRVSGNMLSASWDSPKTDDKTTMAYCGATASIKNPSATESVSEINARVDFTAKELRSYEGYEIQTLSFYPLSNASFEIQLYEGDTELATIPVEDAKLGEWNTINLKDGMDQLPIIKKNTTYHYMIVCFDCPAGQAPLGIDNYSSKNDYSSLIQSAGEDSWYSIYEETGLDGNWLMRMGIAGTQYNAIPVKGYEVYIDDVKKSTVSSNWTNVQIDENNRKLRVDAIYVDPDKTIKGNNVYFSMAEQTGIEHTFVTPIKKSNAIFNMAGQKVNDRYKGIVIKNGKTVINK